MRAVVVREFGGSEQTAPPCSQRLQPSRAVDSFAQKVGVAVVPGILLDHVDVHPAHAHLGVAVANPKLFGEREQARQMLMDRPANRPVPGTAVVTDKGLSGEDTEAFFASPDLDLALIRPACKDEKEPRPFPN